MIDYLRPFLFPVTICTVVGCVWAIGWNKSIEDQIARHTRSTTSPRYVADPAEESAESMTAPHGCQATASIHDE